MKRTNFESGSEMVLNEAELELVQGGAQLTVRVVDPTPAMDAETLRKLHEQLNRRGVRGI